MMDTTDLDRLEQSVRRALERITALESDKLRLAGEKSALEQRLKQTQSTLASRIESPPVPSPDRLAEIKGRLQRLIEIVRTYERGL